MGKNLNKINEHHGRSGVSGRPPRLAHVLQRWCIRCINSDLLSNQFYDAWFKSCELACGWRDLNQACCESSDLQT